MVEKRKRSMVTLYVVSTNTRYSKMGFDSENIPPVVPNAFCFGGSRPFLDIDLLSIFRVLQDYVPSHPKIQIEKSTREPSPCNVNRSMRLLPVGAGAGRSPCLLDRHRTEYEERLHLYNLEVSMASRGQC